MKKDIAEKILTLMSDLTRQLRCLHNSEVRPPEPHAIRRAILRARTEAGTSTAPYHQLA